MFKKIGNKLIQRQLAIQHTRSRRPTELFRHVPHMSIHRKLRALTCNALLT